jgi:hypothetical protein
VKKPWSALAPTRVQAVLARPALEGLPVCFKPGVRVFAPRSGRTGLIRSVISPSRAGRCIYVVWEGTRDLALVRPDEIELATVHTVSVSEPVRLSFLWLLPEA